MKTTKLEITAKAWCLNTSKLKEYWMYDIPTIFAKTRNEARQQLLKKYQHEDLFLSNGEEVDYLNIPIVRSPNNDKVLFEGEEIERYLVQYKIDLANDNALKRQLLSNSNVTHCYIKKRGQYYRPRENGYTSDVTQAGVYEKIEAVNICLDMLELKCIPIDNTQHNQRIKAEIAKLQRNLIL